MMIKHSFFEGKFGVGIVATTENGVCFLAFGENSEILSDLKNRFDGEDFVEGFDDMQKLAIDYVEAVSGGAVLDEDVKLDLRGTDFQKVVWNELRKIQSGELRTYGELAEAVGRTGASRAVGTAIGNNPVSVIVPCHRVIRSDGGIGGYRWGIERKRKILECEGFVL